MKRIVLNTLLFIALFSNLLIAQPKTLAFKIGQLKSVRVKDAYDIKWPELQEELKAIKVNPYSFDIYFRAFKYERILELG